MNFEVRVEVKPAKIQPQTQQHVVFLRVVCNCFTNFHKNYNKINV